MDRRIHKGNRTNRYFLKLNNNFYTKQLNRLILVLVILLAVFIVKLINNNSTNKVINIIEKNIYYDFNIKEDGKKVKDYLTKLIGGSKERIEELLAKQLNRISK